MRCRMPIAMDFQALIRSILARTGNNQAALAHDLGVSQPTVSRWLAAVKPSEPTISAYFKAREMAERLGILTTDPGALRVPIISWVQAGVMVTPDSVQEVADAPTILAPDLDPAGSWIALRVEGASMDRISPPGSIIFANLRDTRLVPNGCYVIYDQDDGSASYKRFRPNPDRWEPVSTSPHFEPLYIGIGPGPQVIGRVRRSLINM